MARAAGLIVVAPDGSMLLLRRTGGDFAGHWSLPAGHVEDGETALAAAIRETAEETGATDLDFDVDPSLVVMVDDDFAAFCAEASDAFEPVLNEEHDAHQWAGFSDLPEPLHPTIRPMLEELQRHFGYVEPTADSVRVVDAAADAPKVKAGREVHVHLHRK